MSKQHSLRLSHALAPLLLLGLVLFGYHPSLDNGFHFDDLENITQAPSIRLDTLTLQGLSQAASDSLLPNRPIPYITFAFDWWRGQGEARAFQQTNLLIHSLNSLLVFALLLLLLQQTRARAALLPWLALLGAALWALHPIQIQGVTYIVQRMAALATLFTLLSAYCYLRARLANGHSWPWLITSLVSFVIAALCKENAWITPLLIILLEYGVVRHRQPLIQQRYDYLLLGLPVLFGLMVIIDLVSGAGPLSRYIAPGYAIREFTLEQRLLTQPGVVLFYLSQFIWPLPGRFSIEHDVVVATGLFSPAVTFMALLAISAWAIAGLWLWLKQPYRLWGVVLLWPLLTLAVESSAMPLEMIFEHRMYLPSVGLVGVLVLALAQLNQHPRLQISAITLTTLFLIGCLFSTQQRLPDWQSNRALYESALDNAPNSARLRANLAMIYLREQQPSQARQAAAEALQLQPDFPLALEVEGLLLMDQGLVDQAYQQFLQAMLQGVPSSSLLNHMGEAALALQRYPEAHRYFNRAIEQKPWNTAYYWNNALALEGLGDCRQAQQQWQQFLQRDDNPADRQMVQQHLREHYQIVGGKCRGK